MTQPTPYERFGGPDFFASLVAAFYRRVREDAVLSPMYPQDDWAGAERRLRTFLEQYWGGPTTYSEERGHPMLRARHLPYKVDSAARDRWIINMHEALVEQGLPAEDEAEIWQYVVSAAFAMQNTADEAPQPGLPVTDGAQ